MYPFFRLASIMFSSTRRSRIDPGEPSDLSMLCWPWDCDMFLEMNNGRHLTLFDLGRFDFGARTGLPRALKQNRWGLVVAGSSIRYRKRLRPFERFTMRTRLLGRDDRWFYFQQTTMSKGTCCSSALIRTGITSKGKVIETDTAAEALGFSEWRPDLPDWVRAWADADSARPWPPESA